MFNWLTVKKFVFLSGVIGASGTPIYYLNKSDDEIDKNLKNEKIIKKKRDFLRGSVGYSGGNEYQGFSEELLNF